MQDKGIFGKVWKNLTAFRVKTDDDEIKKFYMAMRQQIRQPKLYVKLHKVLNNIECLIATDLSAAFDMSTVENRPKRKAALFLQNIADTGILGLDANFLKDSFFLQQSIQSNLGTHCTFGLRHQGKILGESAFVVHLDNNHRVVMLYCIYQQFTKLLEDGLESVESAVDSYTDALNKAQDTLTSAYITDTILSPEWSSGYYQPYQEIKVATEEGSFIWLIDEAGQIRHQYAIDADLSRPCIGHVWDDVWYGDLQQARHRQPKAKRVVLRDLNSTLGNLAGRYVKLEDQITKRWKPKAITLESDPKTDSSIFDRMQAYYHIDRIQRYFRDLGLTVLDEFSSLNPLRVVLTKATKRRTSYTPNEKSIYLKQIASVTEKSDHTSHKDWQMDWTDARDSMTVYHEYVHAVTDALASLRHQDSTNTENPRYRDMLQAAAMDEGLADYFACSLAVAEGAKKPQIGILRQVATDDRATKLEWKLKRNLVPKPQLQLVHRQTIAELAGREDALLYEWGEQWGRFLWNLRTHKEIGAEVADILIAHSILYLTRWSSFNIGILAILLVDQQLFGGSHGPSILATSALNVKQISKKPQGPLHDDPAGTTDWFVIDLGTSGAGNRREEESAQDTADTETDIDFYLVDEWVFEDDEPIKIRHKIDIK